MSTAGKVRVWRFLRLAGVLAVWQMAILLVIAAYTLYSWRTLGRCDEGVNMWLIVFPIASGTGLLAAGREGKLDLLLGSGIGRRRAFLVSLVWAVGVPTLGAAVLGTLSVPATDGGQRIVAAALRAVCAALLTGGCCFSAGMVHPRYVLGVAWIAARIALIITPSGLTLIHALSAVKAGAPMPASWKVLAASLAFPELMLLADVPLYLAVVLAAAGALSVLLTRAVFDRADFSGHRSV